MEINDDDAASQFSLDNFDEPVEETEEQQAEPTQKVRSAFGERRAPRQLWLISYSDFMTILMIFFLAMYGYTYLAKATLLQMQNQTTYSEFAGRVQDMKKVLGDQIKVQDQVDKVVIQLGEKILFPSGSATLSAEATPTLEELAKSIKLVEGDVIVQGHTDNVPMRGGRYKSNWELSAARTFSVIKELTRHGVPPERLAAWGFGEHRPLVDNLSAENRAQNRRIEVVVLKKKPKE